MFSHRQHHRFEIVMKVFRDHVCDWSQGDRVADRIIHEAHEFKSKCLIYACGTTETPLEVSNVGIERSTNVSTFHLPRIMDHGAECDGECLDNRLNSQRTALPSEVIALACRNV